MKLETDCMGVLPKDGWCDVLTCTVEQSMSKITYSIILKTNKIIRPRSDPFKCRTSILFIRNTAVVKLSQCHPYMFFYPFISKKPIQQSSVRCPSRASRNSKIRDRVTQPTRHTLFTRKLINRTFLFKDFWNLLSGKKLSKIFRTSQS